MASDDRQNQTRMVLPPHVQNCPNHVPEQTYLYMTCQAGLISGPAQRCFNCGQLDLFISAPKVVPIEAGKKKVA